MEMGDPSIQEDVNIVAIKHEYKRAFVFINKGLSTDESGFKEEAKKYYLQGREHLLRGLSITSEGHTCSGASWESARQMQIKMQETLQNVNTRLGILDGSLTDAQEISSSLSPMPPLYPELHHNKKPERPPPPSSLILPGQPSTSNGSYQASGGPVAMANPLSPVASAVTVEPPPAYSPQASDGHYTVSYGTDSGEFSSVGDDFYSMRPQPPPLESIGVDVEELILIPHGVQIFYVTPDGQVSAPSYPGYLRIVKFMDAEGAAAQNRPPAFLQVCDWLYPLMCTQSPVLHYNTGVYMFPDVMSQVVGCYVGVVLSAELPAADRELFEDLLSQMSDLRVQDVDAAVESIDLSQTVHIVPEPPGEDKEKLPEWSEKVAHGILSGASWISWGLVKGAEYTGKAIHKGASKLREHIQPDENPTEVSPTVAKGLNVAKQATGGAVKVSQFLVDGVCAVASCVGKELAPHVKKHGSKLIPEALKKDKDGKSPLDGALVVAASGVQGFATVWQGLECAAKNITKSVASETVQTVRHKYGRQPEDHHPTERNNNVETPNSHFE
ncbi:spartin isoform X2 [Pleurodeles waltl]|uniref:spartin isoform X2 n=1 Tax=Pleurodeles waltl TaxID=8319 RepID=UPI0037096A0D